MNNNTICYNNFYFYGLPIPINISYLYNGSFLTLTIPDLYDPDLNIEIWCSEDNKIFQYDGFLKKGLASYPILNYVNCYLGIKIRAFKDNAYSGFSEPFFVDISSSLQNVSDIDVHFDIASQGGYLDNDPMTLINDLSINGNNAIQVAVDRNPIYKTNILNGLPAVYFDGINDVLSYGNHASTDIDDNVTIMIVFKTDNDAVRQTILGCQDVANGFQLEIGLNPSARTTLISGTIISQPIASDVPGFEILTYRRDGAGANHKWRINGVTMVNTTNAVNSFLPIGTTKYIGRRDNGNQYFKGYICEIIIWHSSLTDTNLLESERFLSKKWSIPLELEKTNDNFTLAVIPDSQEWTFDDIAYNAYMLPMMQYLSGRTNLFKLSSVIHVGDITSGCTNDQWLRWNNAFALLDKDKIPFVSAIGNHDYDGGSCNNRLAVRFNAEFSQNFYTEKTWFNGAFYEINKTENLFWLMTLDNIKLLFLSLEFGMRQGVIDWANDLISKYNDRQVIIITHAYSFNDGTRISAGDAFNPHTLVNPNIDVHDGDEIWTELVRLATNTNIIQIWSGHETGFFATKVMADGGNNVQEILAAHTSIANQWGSIGIAQFNYATNKVKLLRYSPGLDSCTYRKIIDIN